MGCAPSKPSAEELDEPGGAVKSFKKPKWRAEQPTTEEELRTMREEFWDTQPHYGGDRVIWDALRAACEADLPTAKLILASAGVVVAAPDMGTCYDERGWRYELPHYVISDPVNLRRPSSRKPSAGSEGGAAGAGAADAGAPSPPPATLEAVAEAEAARDP